MINFSGVYQDSISLDPTHFYDQLYLLENPDEIVLHAYLVPVFFNYPIEHPKTISLNFPGGEQVGVTRKELLEKIFQQYQKIYQEEELTSSNRPDFVNGERNTTHGVWGIWGYNLGSLRIKGMKWISDIEAYQLLISS